MYLYGGSIGLSSNPVFYALDLTKLIWETVRTKPYQNIEENTPAPRDEHTAIIHDEQMIVFGGFVDGERVNHTFRFIFKTGEWKLVTTSGEAVPPPRAGHSATLHVSDESGEPFMYIFGGKDLQNTKLNDLWRLSLTRDVWEQIEYSQDQSEIPVPRSGHSCQTYNGNMIVFGGIQEITKELNDCFIYNYETNSWTQMSSD